MLSWLLTALTGQRGVADRASELRLAHHGTLEEIGTYLSGLRPALEAQVRRSFTELVHHAPDIVATAYASLLADDARPIRSFTGRARLSTFVSQVVRRKALDLMRQSRPVDQLPAHSDLADPAQDPLVTVLHREEFARALHSISQLPPAQRRVVRLYYLANQSCREIAAVLGKPLNSVTRLLSEGRQRARAMCQAEEAPAQSA